MRRALVQSNRDIGLVDLMQIGGASAEDLEWCTRNGLETSSDLQYISAAHIPKGGALESLWKELQGAVEVYHGRSGRPRAAEGELTPTTRPLAASATPVA